MREFRRYRRAIAVLAAAFMGFATTLPGMVAAAQGPVPQFPLCTLDGLKVPGDEPGSAFGRVHCVLCQVPGGIFGATPDVAAGAFTAPMPRVARVAPAVTLAPILPSMRGELLPLQGRAPPQSAL